MDFILPVTEKQSDHNKKIKTDTFKKVSREYNIPNRDNRISVRDFLLIRKRGEKI